MSLRLASANGHRRSAAFVVTALVSAMCAVGLGPVAPASAAPAKLNYVGAVSSAGLRASHTLRVPASVAAGDTLVLFLTTNSPSGTITNPTGWRLLQSRDGATTKGRLWTKTATATDKSTVVTVRSSVTVRSTLSLAAYRSSAKKSVVTASAATVANVSAGTHVAPALPVSQAGSWLVNMYAGKNSATTVWTNPAGTVRRTGAASSGSGQMTAIMVDSGKVVPTGTAASRVAKTNAALAGRQLYTIAISPGTAPTTPPPPPPPPPVNRAPVAAFTSSCDSLACSFDATGSTDADGDALTYAWAFGDGATGTGATPSHTYSGTGTRNVTLTVNDGKATTPLAKPVTATYAEPLPGHTSLVPETPRTDMPKITNGEIHDIDVVGSRVYVAGTFTAIANQRGGDTTSYNQRYLAAYDLNTGLVDPDFHPTFDGPAGFDVAAVQASPDGTRLYVAGGFNTVNGLTRKGLVRLDPATGNTVTDFTADTDARATEIAVSNSTVYVGGRFGKVSNAQAVGSVRKSLAAVDALTGAVDPGFVNNLSGGIGVNGGLAVQKLMLTRDGSKLVVVHTGKQINGQDRYGIALIATGSKQLLPWRTRLWDENLQFVGGVQRIISGAIAPDDSYFVVSSGSGGDRPPINDTVVAYSFTGGDDVKPLWVSRAFDSVYSTAISEKAVYIGGHFAWNESPSAPDPWPGAADVGYGTGQGLSGYGLGDSVVSREHLGALNPADGKALEWNPGSNSDIGNTAMALTPRGLITGGDATTQGGLNVGRLAVFDFDAPTPAPNGVETTITKPISGRVVGAGTELTIEGTATAPKGVRKVFVEVQNRGTLQWLQPDKQTWGTSANMQATVTQVTPTTATWSLTLVVPGNIKMLARARAQGNDVPGGTDYPEDPIKALKKFETFGLDDAPPTMTYTAPAAGLVNTQTFTIQGTTADDRGVTGISMTLRDEAGRYLQDDGSADSSYNSIGIAPDVPNATSTTWSKEVTVPSEGTWQAQARARDTNGNSSLDTTDRTWNVSANGQAPSVSISSPGSVVPPTAPQVVTVEPGGPMTFTGSAVDDGEVRSVYVAMLNNSTGENLTVDGTWGIDNGLNLYKLPVTVNQQSYNWTWQTPQNLTPGNYTFAVMAVDDEGISTPQASWAIMTLNAVVAGDAPPKATLTTAGVQPPSESLDRTIAGHATDDHGVNAVQLIVKDLDTSRYLKADGTTSATYTTLSTSVVDPGATSTDWSRQLTLPNQGNWNITAYAVDTVGQRDLANTGATARYPVYPGDVAPTLTDNLLAPTEGASFTEGKIFVSGRAEDDQATAKAEVAIVNSSNQYLTASGTFASAESWRAAFLTSPGTSGSNFAYTTPVLPAGSYQVKIRAVDQHGLVTTNPAVRNVVVSIPPGNTKPVAVLHKTCTENVCDFDAKSSTDESAPTLTYTWNFGNGASGTGPNPTKTYTTAGVFTVTLTARDEWGTLSDPVTTTVSIAEPAGNTAPAPVIQTPACSGLTCNFSAVGTTDPDTGDSIAYAWNFGDTAANTAVGAATSHAFTAAGTYTVTLTATDGWGNPATVTRDVTVTAP
jgi:PKD repeat protein